MLNKEKGKQIAKNAFMLYIRLLFTMSISLYISRIVLNALGIEDYGIYNVVGGVVAMFSFLNAAMAVSTQRFLSFELGRQDQFELKRVFSTAVTIHLLIGLFILILAESIGFWFIKHHLNIPIERIDAAHWVYQCTIFSFFFLIVRVPYQAGIIAHEKMNMYAYLSIFEVVLKLIAALLLIDTSYDKLKLYSVLSLLAAIVTTVFYKIYCYRKFNESKFSFIWDRNLFKVMTSYAGWSLFGSAASIGYNQGINILLNIFFNPVINAARAIAFQVNTAIQSFTNNFQLAVNPQIVKSYAIGDEKYMMSLIFQSSKYSFFLLYIIALPVLLETEYILKLWLKTVPDYTSIFCKLIVIDALIGCVSYPLMVASQATGRIRLYQFVVGTLLLLNLPLTYIFFKFKFGPEYSMYVSIILSIIALATRLIMLKRLISLNIKVYIKAVIIRALLVGCTAFMIPFYVTQYIDDLTLVYFLLSVVLCVICTVLSIYYLGLDVFEKEYIRDRIAFVFRKFRFGR